MSKNVILFILPCCYLKKHQTERHKSITKDWKTDSPVLSIYNRRQTAQKPFRLSCFLYNNNASIIDFQIQMKDSNQRIGIF